MKTAFNEAENPIKEKTDLNAKDKKILEMNPKIKLEELNKIRASNKEFTKLNKFDCFEKVDNNLNKRPTTSKIIRLKQSQSNIFHSDV